MKLIVNLIIIDDSDCGYPSNYQGDQGDNQDDNRSVLLVALG